MLFVLCARFADDTVLSIVIKTLFLSLCGCASFPQEAFFCIKTSFSFINSWIPALSLLPKKKRFTLFSNCCVFPAELRGVHISGHALCVVMLHERTLPDFFCYFVLMLHRVCVCTCVFVLNRDMVHGSPDARSGEQKQMGDGCACVCVCAAGEQWEVGLGWRGWCLEKKKKGKGLFTRPSW